MEWRSMRRFKQQLTKEECLEVLKNEPRGILAMHGENGYPYAIPLDFYYNDADGRIYFHCAKTGNKIDLLGAENKVCFTVMDEGFRKDGDWALNIKSVVVFGRIGEVSDRDMVVEHVRNLGLKYYPTPEDVEEEIRKAGSRVKMLYLEIDRMTGKLVNES